MENTSSKIFVDLDDRNMELLQQIEAKSPKSFNYSDMITPWGLPKLDKYITLGTLTLLILLCRGSCAEETVNEWFSEAHFVGHRLLASTERLSDMGLTYAEYFTLRVLYWFLGHTFN